MTIFKKGSPEKIQITIVSKAQFDDEYAEIVKENSLAKCPTCGKLISKLGSKGMLTIQHRGIKGLAKSEGAKIQCTCGTAISFEK